MKKTTRSKARKKKHLRIRSKISGTPEIPRLNVFKSLKNIEAQLIDDINRKTLAHSSTIALKLPYGGNIKAAQKVGEDIAKKIKTLKIKKIVFDRSGYIYHGRVKALADRVREKGVKF
jgi:large subunit ribosomal protein L18